MCLITLEEKITFFDIADGIIIQGESPEISYSN